MKYIMIQRNKAMTQTRVTIPAHINKQLINDGVDMFNVEFKDGKLIYSPVKVVE